MKFGHVILVAVVAAVCAEAGSLTAGVAVKGFHEFSPIGVPLAGYNHGARRVPDWPVPKKTAYTTFMMPATGTFNDNYCKVLTLDDGNGGLLALVTLDVIGSDTTMNQLVLEALEVAGSRFNMENVIFTGSHTHSGPGAVSPRLLWALAPATDLLVEEVQAEFVKNIAATILEAEAAMEPATMDIGIEQVKNLTVNRIAKNIPWLEIDDIDPNMAVIGVNKADGSVLATVFNLAFHSVCYGPSNMHMSADLAGSAQRAVEDAIGGVGLYINGDAGDIDPARGQIVNGKALPDMCAGGTETSDDFVGGKLLAERVVAARAKLSPTADATLTTAFHATSFGPTSMNLTLGRIGNCTQGGPLDICSFCKFLDCSANLHLDGNWVDGAAPLWYSGVLFNVNGKKIPAVTFPGELLSTPGNEVRAAAKEMGFADGMAIFGYSQAHAGYFVSQRVYDYSGAPDLYESQLDFWGQLETHSLVLPPALDILKELSTK